MKKIIYFCFFIISLYGISIVIINIIVDYKISLLSPTTNEDTTLSLRDGGKSLAYQEYNEWKAGWKKQAPKQITTFEEKLYWVLYGNRNYVPFKSAEEAWLYYSILNNALLRKDKVLFEKVKELFDTQILPMEINNIQQSVWGMVGIELYKKTGKEKYNHYIKQIYNFIIQNDHERYGILYGGGDLFSVDGYGMTTPFLSSYAKLYNDSTAYHHAIKQINGWIEANGCNQITGLPYMTINIKSPNMPIGPPNWGRGVAWFTIGLSFLNRKDLNQESQIYIDKLDSTLVQIWKKDRKFTQLIRRTSEIDLSATFPIIYYLQIKGLITISTNDINKYKTYFHNGCFYNSSGPNMGNTLSTLTNPNPLADAFFFMILNHAISTL